MLKITLWRLSFPFSSRSRSLSTYFYTHWPLLPHDKDFCNKSVAQERESEDKFGLRVTMGVLWSFSVSLEQCIPPSWPLGCCFGHIPSTLTSLTSLNLFSCEPANICEWASCKKNAGKMQSIICCPVFIFLDVLNYFRSKREECSVSEYAWVREKWWLISNWRPWGNVSIQH